MFNSDVSTRAPTLTTAVAFNRNLVVNVSLPELPLPNSLQLVIEAVDASTLTTLVLNSTGVSAAHTERFLLNARQFTSSPLVTSVHGRDYLVHNTAYKLSVLYQDYFGNGDAYSAVKQANFGMLLDICVNLQPGN